MAIKRKDEIKQEPEIIQEPINEPEIIQQEPEIIEPIKQEPISKKVTKSKIQQIVSEMNVKGKDTDTTQRYFALVAEVVKLGAILGYNSNDIYKSSATAYKKSLNDFANKKKRSDLLLASYNALVFLGDDLGIDLE